MEFLRTPDIGPAQRWSAVTPGSLNVPSAKSALTPATATLIVPQPVITPAKNPSPANPSSATPHVYPTPSPPQLDRAGIKNSFQSLFSPNVSSTPALLSRAMPTAPGITPFINGMVTPCLIPPGSSMMQAYPHLRTPAQGGDPVAINHSVPAADPMLSSPYLQAAAKEAVRREFLNMPSLVASPAEMAHNSERVVPGNSPAQDGASPSHPVIVTNDGVAVPTGSQSKNLSSPSSDTRTSEESRAVPQGPSKSPSHEKNSAQTGKTSHPMQQMHPQMLHPQSHPPPGMVMFGQPPHMMMAAPPPSAMYPPPPGMVMFPGSTGQPMMTQQGMLLHPGHPAAQMVPPPGPPGKAETTAERKERIEVEKQELIREFKKKTREAALVRFRQKRRERRFGKLIRYDCRKKLADARPRVKGRFVRIKADEDDESEGPQVVPNLGEI